jgi:hypothetical protein
MGGKKLIKEDTIFHFLYHPTVTKLKSQRYLDTTILLGLKLPVSGIFFQRTLTV